MTTAAFRLQGGCVLVRARLVLAACAALRQWCRARALSTYVCQALSCLCGCERNAVRADVAETAVTTALLLLCTSGQPSRHFQSTALAMHFQSTALATHFHSAELCCLPNDCAHVAQSYRFFSNFVCAYSSVVPLSRMNKFLKKYGDSHPAMPADIWDNCMHASCRHPANSQKRAVKTALIQH